MFLMPFGSRFDRGRHYNGFGRFGMDFWNLPGDGTLIGKFRRWHNLYRTPPRWMLFPAEEGPVASQHTEAIREGAALAEAMLQLHEALHPGSDGPRLDEQMRTRVREAYLGMYRLYRQQFGSNSDTRDQADRLSRDNWQTAVREVFDAAGALQGESPPPAGGSRGRPGGPRLDLGCRHHHPRRLSRGAGRSGEPPPGGRTADSSARRPPVGGGPRLDPPTVPLRPGNAAFPILDISAPFFQ